LNPLGWAADTAGDLAAGGASSVFVTAFGGLVGLVVKGVVWLVGHVFGFFVVATSPNVQSDWFVAGTGPYATTVGIGAVLLVLFVFAGITQGVIAGDTGGMVRRMVVDLPMSVFGMVALVGVVQVAIGVTDALSEAVMANFSSEIADFVTIVASLARMSGSETPAQVVLLVLGVITILAGLVLVAELVIRSSLIYIVVALAPLVFAARLWPATKDATQRLLQLLAALIVSKLVVAIALAIAAAAAVGAGSGGEVTVLPAPEATAADPNGSVTQAVGILLLAFAAFAVAAFSPMLIARLLPLTEGASVAQGLRGAPARLGQQGLMMANTAQMMSARLGQIAGRNPTTNATNAANAGGTDDTNESNGPGDGPAPGGRSPWTSPTSGADQNPAASAPGASGAGPGGTGSGAGAGAAGSRAGAGTAGAGAGAAGAAAGPVGAAAGAAKTAADTSKKAVDAGVDAAVTTVEWSTRAGSSSSSARSPGSSTDAPANPPPEPPSPSALTPGAAPLAGASSPDGSSPVVEWQPRAHPDRSDTPGSGAGDAPGGDGGVGGG
jgi:type IV secretion system protein TrbL